MNDSAASAPVPAAVSSPPVPDGTTASHVGGEVVRISVIISTRNRAEQLPLCLEALMRQRDLPSQAYEVIVVDNASRDHTRQVVGKIQQQSDRVRYLYEEKLGLSAARNAGAAQARGEIICFVDDDAIPAPGFLEEVLLSFENRRATCVGGKIVAEWPDGAAPAWFTPRYAHVVAQTSFGEAARRLARNEFPFGANIAFRREIFQSLGGFDENLGKRAGNNIWGEEIDLCHRLQGKGFAFFYNPRALVWHVVGRGRATEHYFIESIFGKGITEGHQKLTHRGPAVFTFYLLLKAARLAVTSLCYLMAGPFLSETRRFQLRCMISWCTGYLYFLAVRDPDGSIRRSSEANEGILGSPAGP
jgi:GT2 family glycosyltransferase